MSTINTTPINVSFHADYRSGIETGLRIPIDDGGQRSALDRPFALASNDPAWELGSANRVVKYIHDFYGGYTDPLDVTDWNAGLLGIPRLRKYLRKSLMYGKEGGSRNKIPKDLMSFRGYPTYELVGLEYLSIALNLDDSSTEVTLNERITSTSDNWVGQVAYPNGTSLPIEAGSDYVIVSGKVTIKEPLPFDSIYIALAQEVSIEDFGTANYDPMFDGTYFDRDWAAKTECHNSGDNLTFYFRLSAEITNAHLDDGDKNPKNISIKFGKDRLTPFEDDAWYGYPTLGNNDISGIPVTWDGSKWIGSTAIVIDNEAPTAPQNLRVTSQVGTILNLDWTDSTDNIGIRGYRLYYKEYGTTRGFHYLDTLSSNYSMEVDGNTRYIFYVEAYDLAGNFSEPSNELDHTTSGVTQLQIVYIDYIGRINYQDTCDFGNNNDVCFVENAARLLGGGGGLIYTDEFGFNVLNGQYLWYSISEFRGSNNMKTVLVDIGGYANSYRSCN